MVLSLTQNRGGWESVSPPHPFNNQPTDTDMEKTQAADEVQYGGTHYKQFQYETWNVILDWGLGYLDGNAVKYLSRWRHKNGIEDLRKAAHYIQKLIEVEEANGNARK